MRIFHCAVMLLAMMAAPIQARTVLFKAKLMEVTELSEADRNKFYSKNGIGEVRFDSVFRMKLHPLKTLIGYIKKDEIFITRASARPAVGGSYYILYDESGESGNVIWYGNVLSGLCLDQDTANQHRVGRAVTRLRHSLPCKN